MYAIVETGGKQVCVSPGDVVLVEKLNAAEPGSQVILDRVLAVAKDDGTLTVGSPVVAGAKVTAQVVENGKLAKIDVFKYKSKVNYRRRYGHRQPFTKLKIESIEA